MALDALATATQNVQVLSNRLIAQQAPTTDLAAVAYELGLIAELQHDWQTAATHYADAVAKFGADNPDAYVAMVALGRVERLAGDGDATKQTLQNAMQLDEQVPWAWLELAQLHAGTFAAKTDLAKAREVAPNQAYVYLVEAELCGAWDDFPACAQAAYAQALTKRPQSGWLYDRVGEFISQANRSWIIKVGRKRRNTISRQLPGVPTIRGRRNGWPLRSFKVERMGKRQSTLP